VDSFTRQVTTNDQASKHDVGSNRNRYDGQATTNDQADLGGQVTTNVTRQPVIGITKLLQ